MEESVKVAINKSDLDQIRAIAVSNGLVNSSMRSKAWPIFLKAVSIEGIPEDQLPTHKDEEQIKLDINRSFVFYPVFKTDEEKKHLRESLQKIIIRFFRSNPLLSYYQGFHDICTVFLLTFEDEDDAYKYFSSFALNYLRDFMMPDISSSVQVLKLVPELSSRFDSSLDLHDIPPFFCISAIIAAFAHDIKGFDTISLIFDQIITVQSYDIIIYLYVTLLLSKKKELQLDSEDVLHSSLSNILKGVTVEDVQKNLSRAFKRQKMLPLSRLKSWNDLNKFSILRTKFQPNLSQIKNKTIPRQIQSHDGSSYSVLSNLPDSNLLKVTLTIGVLSILFNIIFSTRESSMH